MSLNDIMDFEHVVEVTEDGEVISRPDIYAPELWEGNLLDDSWGLLGGYTGQYGGGDTMHNSEFIGGRLETDILDSPGIYVAVICYWEPDGPEDGDGEVESYIEGWAVAYRK